MTQFSVRDAADRVGVTRQTIFKYIKQGKLSATLARDGAKQIDAAELMRVFGDLSPVTSKQDDRGDKVRLSPSTTTTGVLQVELERLKAMLEVKDMALQMAQERIEELKARENQAKQREQDSNAERLRLIGVIEQQGRLLAPPAKVAKVRKKVQAPVPAPETVSPPPLKESLPAAERKKGKAKKGR